MTKYDGRVNILESKLPDKECLPAIYDDNGDGTYTGPNGELLTKEQFKGLTRKIIIIDDIRQAQHEQI